MEEEIKALGERLALLLAAAPLPDDVKEAWATLIPEMSIEQIDRLVGIIEKETAGALAEELSDVRADILHIKDMLEVDLTKAALVAERDIKSVVDNAQNI